MLGPEPQLINRRAVGLEPHVPQGSQGRDVAWSLHRTLHT